ncbi:peptidoglycan-binding domain-containing protein [Sorangium sp. So ce513]|uniref:peptidoglycan-binding domain-containing protein n=1 Tax=Sorangium sp. So ce513 TaxID=3133315 RepID=UPI003F6084EF
MPIVEVRRGDCIASIAADHGVDDWRTLWDHPDNAELRARRRSPHLLLLGDRVTVPEQGRARLAVSAGQSHRFVARVPSVRLRLTLQDRRGRPLASRRFELRVAGSIRTGTTDGSGRLDEPVPATARRADLRVFLDGDRVLTMPLAIGYLDPDDSESGVRQRLRNLGYLRGRAPEEDGIEGALREFQRDNGLEPTGEADAPTLDCLRGIHKA